LEGVNPGACGCDREEMFGSVARAAVLDDRRSRAGGVVAAIERMPGIRGQGLSGFPFVFFKSKIGFSQRPETHLIHLYNTFFILLT